ncbi:MAG TPA: alpha/beta hydrolase [Anaerolineales bacterium]|nr:alpha/beta hydrolase [Anaerolineales bacterium]
MTTVDPTKAKMQAIVKKAYQAFFSPARYEVKPSEREVIEWGNNYRIPFEGGELAVTTWGNGGPTILLMHGWGGGRAQMTGFVDSLLFAGYRVVAYDQPAHGESDGSMTNLLEIAPSMDVIATQEGPFHAIIAHSFGTLITSYALVKRNFPPPTRLVYLGAFNQLLESLPRFQVIAGLPDEIMAGFRAMLYENFGQAVLEAITNESLTPQIQIPALMFHDAMDNVTPVEDSRAIARVWKHARYIETEGLGHRGALQSKSIHEQVVSFLKEKE